MDVSVLLPKAGKRRGLAASRKQGKEIPGPCHLLQVSPHSFWTNKYSYLLLKNSFLFCCPLALFQESSLTSHKYSMLQFSKYFRRRLPSWMISFLSTQWKHKDEWQRATICKGLNQLRILNGSEGSVMQVPFCRLEMKSETLSDLLTCSRSEGCFYYTLHNTCTAKMLLPPLIKLTEENTPHTGQGLILLHRGCHVIFKNSGIKKLSFQ